MRAAPAGARRWAHCERVYGLGRWLARQADADRFIVGAAALCHDWPLTEGVPTLLADLGVPEGDMAAIGEAIAALARETPDPFNQEATILWEADRLDALGAIGIATLLQETQAAQDAPYDRDDPFAVLREVAPDGPTIDQIFDRLATIPQVLRTPAARQIAIRRSGIMLFFLESLRDELAETIPDALLPEREWLVPSEPR